MNKRKGLICVFIATLSLAFAQAFITPVYSSDDDVLYLLTLSGGFGKAPSAMLQVMEGWHPAFAWLVKTLFSAFPSIHWYTVFLLLFQAAGLAALLYYLQHRMGVRAAAVFYGLLFTLFIIPLLQAPSFTDSAMVAAIGGCLLLCLGNENKRLFYVGGGLLLCALLLRLFISCFVVLSFLPLFYWQVAKARKRLVVCLMAVTASWVVLHSIQREIYIRNVPGWKEQAAFRDGFFTVVNFGVRAEDQPALLGGKPEAALLQAGFFYDTAVYTAPVLKKLRQQRTVVRNPFNPLQQSALRWTVTNNRIYFAFLFLTALLLGWLNRKQLFHRLPFLLFPFGVWVFLFLFVKGTTAVMLTLFLAAFFYLIDGMRKDDFKRRRFLPLYAGACGLLLFGWSVKLAADRNTGNRQKLQDFYCLKSLLQNKERLFVATNYGVALTHLPAWESPAAYRVDNLLYYQRCLLQSPGAILREHGIVEKFPFWLFNPSVRLAGNTPTALPDFCWKRYGLPIQILKDSLAGCEDVYRVVRTDQTESR